LLLCVALAVLYTYAPWTAVTKAGTTHLQLLHQDSNSKHHVQCPWGSADAEKGTWRPVLLPQPGRQRTELLSFPGSGNSWVRHLIETLTGYRTNSIYHCNTKVTDTQSKQS
jgi:hypothetical protein